MVKGFDDVTKPLNEHEKKLVPVIIKGLAARVGQKNAIHGHEICNRISAKYGKITSPRLRKIVNFIRAEGILPIMATSKGYYVSYDKEEIKSQIESLESRVEAINIAVKGLRKWQ